ncbi:hypothetical protein C9374_005092 [Naegleria lovaniensis]|uniref:Arf-GAP domain-containing protein n=1 Tax=Naegleria lovaniensis TaxID=51637 RepID=A0AA88GQ95_NAELO|nr:uncharacterized protein C9374_005092 [Naegleria lovaniensis]KAG2382512.1 hypothetical protein C9374_005092 [Naegleria lovaniensis]
MLKRIQSGNTVSSGSSSSQYSSGSNYNSNNNNNNNTTGSSSPTLRDQQQEQFKKVLAQLLKLPCNAECADCTEARPVWCSATFGTFICLRCAGIHRSLGSHISFVRSAEMDKWDEKHVKLMQLMGNERAREYFEHELPSDKKKPSRLDSTNVVEQFIKDKYVSLKYVPKKEDGKKMTFREFLELVKNASSDKQKTVDSTSGNEKKKKSVKSPTTDEVKKKKKKKPTTNNEDGKSVEDIIGVSPSASSTQSVNFTFDDLLSSPLSVESTTTTPTVATTPSQVNNTADPNTLMGFLSDKFSLIDLGNSKTSPTVVNTTTTNVSTVAVVANNTNTTKQDSNGATKSEVKKKTKKSVKPIKTSSFEDDEEEDEYDAIFQKPASSTTTDQEQKKNAILDLWK